MAAFNPFLNNGGAGFGSAGFVNPMGGGLGGFGTRPPTARVAPPPPAPLGPNEIMFMGMRQTVPDPSTYGWDLPNVQNLDPYYRVNKGSDPLSGAKEAFLFGGSPWWGANAYDVAPQIQNLYKFAQQYRDTPGVLSPNQIAQDRYNRTIGLIPAGEYTMNALQSGGYGLGGATGLYEDILNRYFSQEGLRNALGPEWEKTRSQYGLAPDVAQQIAQKGAMQALGLQSAAKDVNPGFIKEYGPRIAALAAAPFLGPALSAATGLGEVAGSALAGGLLEGVTPMAFGQGFDPMNVLTGAIGSVLGGSGALGQIAGALKDVPVLGELAGAFGGGGFDPFEVDAMQTSGFAPGVSDSPLMRFASSQGMTDVPNLPWLESEMLPDQTYADFFGDQTTGLEDLYPGARTVVPPGGYPMSTSSMAGNPLTELGLGRTPGLTPGALAEMAQLSPYSLGTRGDVGLGGDIPMTPDPKGASMSRKFMEGLGIPPEWLDTLGSGVEFVTQDPLGRSLAAGTLAYLSNKAQQSQAEEMNRQAAAEAAARRQQFDSSGPAVRGGTRRSYLGGPGSYSRYGMGPEHKFWGEEPVPAARGGPLSRLAQGEGGGQGDKIPALLSEGEYVIPSDVVSDLGDGSNVEGARRLDRLRSGVRKHKGRRKGLPPKARAPEQYMKG